jgi:DNA-binding response OmpR family regulator
MEERQSLDIVHLVWYGKDGFMADALQAQESPQGSASTAGAILLVIEDDKFLRDLLVQKLKREGFPVIEAVTGTEGLRIVKEQRPAIVLLDLILPGMDGFEILRRMKEDPETASIPVIILSNLGQREDVEHGLRLGAVDFMIKAHFTPGEIVAKIKDVLKQRAG